MSTAEISPVLDPATGNSALLDRLSRAGGRDGDALRRAEALARTTGEPLDRILTRLGIVSEGDLATTYEELSGRPRVRLDEAVRDEALLDRIGYRFAEAARILPLVEDGTTLRLAMVDPLDDDVVELVEMKLGYTVERYIVTGSEIEAAFETPAGGEMQPGEGHAATEADLARLKDLASDAPVVRLVNQILRRAAELGASDIHVEPFPRRLHLRYRVDGVLREGEAPPLTLRPAIVSRLKIMAGLDIAESRLPQDGRIRTIVLGREIDLRVATVPTLNGEGVVIRLLDRSGLTLDFTSLGLDAEARAGIEALIARPNGIVLVTGPTGSGKTTTLYAALAGLNDRSRKIITVEDPVEYQLEGISQIQVHATIGLGFPQALRSILRQDPDIIMIGEIRDIETARIAVQAALTGHLVLATLHTNSAVAAVARLRDMGVPDYLVAATLNGVVAQRLVRTLCTDCAQPDPDGSALAAKLVGAARAGAWRSATGCPACSESGYRGRTSLVEVLPVGGEMRRGILDAAGEDDLDRIAARDGMRPLARNGIELAARGTTSLAEIVRVVAMA